MSGFNSIKALVDAELDGKFQFTTWRKTPTQITSSGIWFDLSMSPGNPVPNYYAAAPNIAQRLARSTDGGIDHGASPTGQTKHLKQFMALTGTAAAVPLPMILCDYLLYYPFLDMSVTDPQSLDNTNTLSRYTDGAGVQVMAVEVAGQSGIGNPRFQITYTNQAGVTGRVSPSVACNTAVVNGTIITSAPNTADCAGPFIPLAAGDTGVRKVESIQFASADVGLIAMVLVKPIATHTLREITAPVERDFAIDFASMPVIQPDAYLNLICHPSASLSGAPIHGSATFIWS